MKLSTTLYLHESERDAVPQKLFCFEYPARADRLAYANDFSFSGGQASSAASLDFLSEASTLAINHLKINVVFMRHMFAK